MNRMTRFLVAAFACAAAGFSDRMEGPAEKGARWRLLFIGGTLGASVVLSVWQYLVGKRQEAAGFSGSHYLLASTVFRLLNPAVTGLYKLIHNVPRYLWQLRELVWTCCFNLIAPVRKMGSEEHPENGYLGPYQTSKRMFSFFVLLFVTITLANKMELINVGVPDHYKSVGSNKLATELLCLVAESVSLLRYLVGLILIVLVGLIWTKICLTRSASNSEIVSYLMYEYNALFFISTLVTAYLLLFLSGFGGPDRPERVVVAVSLALGSWVHFGWFFHRLRVRFKGNPIIGWLTVLPISFLACNVVYILWLLGIVVFTLSK